MYSVGKVKFDEPQKLSFAIKDFTGGICNTKSPLKINDNQCIDMLNIAFGEDGILKKRSGIKNSKEVMGDTIYGESVQNAFVIEPTPNKYAYLIQSEEALVYFTPVWDEYENGYNLERKFIYWDRSNRDTPIQGVQYMDKFFFVDGGNAIHYFNIEDLETLEEPPIYYIKKPPHDFTPNPSPAINGVVKVEERHDTRYPSYYVWYEPCQLELEDGYKGSNECEFNCKLIQVYKDRLYVSGNPNDPNMVYISDILNPHYFPSALPIQTPPVGDLITALHVYDDKLIIGRRDSVYYLSGNTNRDVSGSYVLKHINTHTGMPNPNCANIVNNYLFYVGTNGQCYKLSTSLSDSTIVSTIQLNTAFDFTLPPLNKSVNEIRKCHTGFDPVKGEWYIQIDEDTVVYNYALMAWTRYNNLDNIKFITIDNKFYIVRRDNTFNVFDDTLYCDTYKYDTYTKVPIECYWKSKTIDFGMPTRIKQIRDTYLVSETWEDFICDIQIKYDIDYIDVVSNQTVTNKVPLWNKVDWDKERFYRHNTITSLPIMVGRRGRTFNITIETPYRFKGIYNHIPTGEDFKKGEIIQLRSGFDESIDGYMIRADYDLETGTFWKPIDNIEDFFQPVKIYELSGVYQLRGYR